jgi:hypothetical protein
MIEQVTYKTYPKYKNLVAKCLINGQVWPGYKFYGLNAEFLNFE